MEKKKNVLFVINPIAGGTNKENFISLLHGYSIRYSYIYQLYFTTGEADKNSISALLKEFDPDIVIAVGGDGTINLVSSLLVQTDRVLSIVPMGSANGLAEELGIDRTSELAMQTVFKGIVKKIDVILINDLHHCFHIADFGLNARIIKRFEKEKTRGFSGYVKQFGREFFFSKPSTFIIRIGERVIRKKAQLLAIANASKYGTGVVINPGGELSDGYFEVCLVRPYPWWAVIKLAFDMLTGRGKNSEYLRIYKTKKVHIINKKLQPFHIDGELFERVKEVKAEILPASLCVMVNG
jgi:diacylglycerol kinase (ATP)